MMYPLSTSIRRTCAHIQDMLPRRNLPTDTDLQGVTFMDPVLVNGKCVDFDMFDLRGSTVTNEQLWQGHAIKDCFGLPNSHVGSIFAESVRNKSFYFWCVESHFLYIHRCQNKTEYQ